MTRQHIRCSRGACPGGGERGLG
ncbi:unnamed protein product [Spirodela intermedia]|uniref:Uncharacterized protein n=2 Tax=Spirodela intermedia TaxID=51605 RepID=A0A7I8J545_SPIIN|nr:unnamed protein product [Spirodela intermedia]CAA6664501.1 unnamed protein product [Spirodela intermedia]CAA7401084.1 unnamed protein product [Spirodela intermedia]